MNLKNMLPYSIGILCLLILNTVVILNFLPRETESGAPHNASSFIALENKFNDLQKEFSKAEMKRVEALEKVTLIEEKQDYLDRVWREHYEEWIRLDYLVKRLPQVTIKMAYIHEIDQSNYAIVDYTEWVFDDNEIRKLAKDNGVIVDVEDTSVPNGNNKDKPTKSMKVKIEPDTLIFILSSDNLTLMEYGDFEEYVKSPPDKLFWLYEVEDQIVLLIEQYLPK